MKGNCSLSVLILTLNEEKHLRRCLKSISQIANEIIIIDSFSNDRTKEIADEFGAKFFQNNFISQSGQLIWAFSNIKFESKWILRIDADEYVTNELLLEIKDKLRLVEKDVNGISLNRFIKFQGHIIKYGGICPTRVLRIFRNGCCKCEDRLMDEHFIVDGKKISFQNPLIDDNLNSLSWWIKKHNGYSSREAIEILNLKYKFKKIYKYESRIGNKMSQRTRFLKNFVYYKFPFQLRSIFYFIYRYFIRLGFLDGIRGFTFHFLQAFWYRYLVDAKVYEFEKSISSKKLSTDQALLKFFDYVVDD